MNFNPEELFKNVQGLQSKMTEMQSKFALIRASGYAGGDMVCYRNERKYAGCIY